MRRCGALAAAALLLVLASIWAVPARAYACSCAAASDERYVSSADVIFTGRIDDDRSDQQTRTITFVVERLYKGDAGPRPGDLDQCLRRELWTRDRRTGNLPGLRECCGRAGQLKANLCGGTRAGGALAILGEGRAPQPESAEPSDSATPAPPAAKPNTGPLLLIIGVVIIIGAFRVAALARRREAR